MARLALTISYDGTDFAGSQTQPGRRTVQAEVERALAALFGEPVRTVFAGRTDRGVHAAGQVAGCEDGRADLDGRTIRAALNARLPPDVAIVGVARRSDGFHARYDARWREYRYRIWCGGREPLVRRLVWQRNGPLDLAAMDAAAGRLVGQHDFASLAGSGSGVPWSAARSGAAGTVRTMLGCSCVELAPWWCAGESRPGRLIEVRTVANGYLPQMVRNIVAALVEVGAGSKPAEWIDALLERRDRRAGPATAPAHGLTLWRVGYDGDDVDAGPTSATNRNDEQPAPNRGVVARELGSGDQP